MEDKSKKILRGTIREAFPELFVQTSFSEIDKNPADHPVSDIDFLISLENGTLTQEERDRFLKHLAVCPSCRNEIAALIRSGILFEDSRDVDRPSDSDPEHSAFSRPKFTAFKGNRSAKLISLVSAAVILAAVGIGSFFSVSLLRTSRYQNLETQQTSIPIMSRGPSAPPAPPSSSRGLDGSAKTKWIKAERSYSEAISYRNSGDYSKALSAIESACSLFPEKYESERADIRRSYISELLNSGNRALFNGDYAEAMGIAEKILSLDSDNEGARKLQDHINVSSSELSAVCYCESPPKKPGGLKILTVNGIEYRFRWCPPGEFQMGSSSLEEGRCDNETQHSVKLTNGFWILETEVTQEMWECVTGSSLSVDDCSAGQGSNYPVYKVSWDESREFCRRLSALSGEEIRLPTESEWEYACRAGTAAPFYTGETLNADTANIDGILGKTSPVKSYNANPWGLYDMHGNAAEWCSDWFGDYPAKPVTDPAGPETGLGRAVRGGSWYAAAKNCRAASRAWFEPSVRSDLIGFRILLVPSKN